MCIHWCCKHCFAKLNHPWAYERCNAYFNARAQDESLTACPNGAWLLRRAHHRHPHRGPQRCDECKKASRADKKISKRLMQSARSKVNKAQGRPFDYNGAIDLGELEIPETIRRTSRLPLASEKLDAMKAEWERFNVTHRHLPSHELEREWTKRFTASTKVGLKPGVSPSDLQNASTVGQRIRPEQGDQVGTAAAGEGSQNSNQYIRRQSVSSTHEANGGHLPQAASRLVHCIYNSIMKPVNNILKALSIAKQLTL